jgi:hypothetical protein
MTWARLPLLWLTVGGCDVEITSPASTSRCPLWWQFLEDSGARIAIREDAAP